MIKEAILLAGGLGTRLRSVVSDVPKCMALVAGKPFLYYILKHLQNEGIEKFIFSLGHLHEKVEEYLITEFPQLNYLVSIEEKPLGTGGAIRLACELASDEDVLVVNGDTLFTIDIIDLYSLHHLKKAGCTLALKYLENFDRYGVVELNEDYKVTAFKEKQLYQQGFINGGCYILNIVDFFYHTQPGVFSFEKDYLEKFFTLADFFGQVQDRYFIDIGIPEDFEKAQQELIPFK